MRAIIPRTRQCWIQAFSSDTSSGDRRGVLVYMSQTVGEFLREKLTNMGTWISSELGQTHSVDIKQYIAERTDTEIAYVVGVLGSNSTMITHRDWSGLARVADIPAELLDVFQLIRKREDMHDKFWRYLELFVEVISNS
jgi:hypothetical protein